MKNIFTFLLLFSPLFLCAQFPAVPQKIWAEQNGEAIFPNHKIAISTDKETQVRYAQAFIIQQLKSFFPQNTNLQTEDFKISPLGTHISFVQAFFGNAIYGTGIKINIDKNGNVNSLIYKLVPGEMFDRENFIYTIDSSKIKALTKSNIISKINKTWFFDGENILPAFVTEYGKNDGTLHLESVFSLDYELLYEIDKHRYSEKKDTVVTAHVFFPDPLTSARKPYGAPFADFDDSDVHELDYERIPLQMKASFANDTFFLENEYIQIAELSAPSTTPTTSSIPIFNFSRSNTSFEDINAIFHIYNFRQHLKKLGFDTLGKITLRVDAHALSGADQSEFDFFNNDLKLLFGEGGIDDAEDADVIVHEYSHFLSYQASGDNAYGNDRLAIEEGLGDYFACSYSKNISPYHWQKVYSWDGNETWSGRSCITSKNYKNDIKGNKYLDAEIWVGTLMEIQNEIGRDKTDALLLGTLYFLAKYMTMPAAAQVLVHADSIMNEGKNTEIIASKFIKNGLLPENYLPVKEESLLDANAKIISAYFQSHNLIYVEFGKPQSGTVKLYDLQGKELISHNFSNTNKVNIYLPQLKQGMYLLNLQYNNSSKTIKLVK